MKLTDAKALELTKLLRAYFEDCVREDPTTTHPGNLSVRELLEDLETSVSEHEVEIGHEFNCILSLFD